MHRSENREQPSTNPKSKKAIEAQLLAADYTQNNLKDLGYLGASKNSAACRAQVMTIASMRLQPSMNQAKTSARQIQNKPATSRKAKRSNSPKTSAKRTGHNAAARQKDMATVYATQRSLPMN